MQTNMEMLFFHAYYKWGVPPKLKLPQKPISYHSLGVSSCVIWGGAPILETPHKCIYCRQNTSDTVSEILDQLASVKPLKFTGILIAPQTWDWKTILSYWNVPKKRNLVIFFGIGERGVLKIGVPWTLPKRWHICNSGSWLMKAYPHCARI